MEESARAHERRNARERGGECEKVSANTWIEWEVEGEGEKQCGPTTCFEALRTLLDVMAACLSESGSQLRLKEV